MADRKKKPVRKKKVEDNLNDKGYDYRKDPLIKKKGEKSVKILTKYGFPKPLQEGK